MAFVVGGVHFFIDSFCRDEFASKVPCVFFFHSYYSFHFKNILCGIVQPQ